MVVDINRKETESYIFDSNYYKLSITDIALQKLYYTVSGKENEIQKYLVENFVSTSMRPKKESHEGIFDKKLLEEFHADGLKEITQAMLNFFKAEVENWKHLEIEEKTKLIKTYIINMEDNE